MQRVVAAVTAVLTLATTGVSSLQCYQCFDNPEPGFYYNTTDRLCMRFDASSKFIVDCPLSTMCMKKDIYLYLGNGKRIDAVERGCAPQTFKYQDYKNGHWSPKMEVLEPYQEGCQLEDKGERATTHRNCYCRSNLCNTSTSSHEAYTDIMGVIVVFNLMKYINSLT